MDVTRLHTNASSQLYVLGRFVEEPYRSSPLLIQNEIYVYSTVTKTWDLITSDAFADGGPRLAHDMQVWYGMESYVAQTQIDASGAIYIAVQFRADLIMLSFSPVTRVQYHAII